MDFNQSLDHQIFDIEIFNLKKNLPQMENESVKLEMEIEVLK